MLVGSGPFRPMRTNQDLQQLYTELLAAWQLHRAKQTYSQCLPVLMKPSNERSMDERHLAVWCIDREYKGLGTYFQVLHPESEGHTAAEALAVFDICGHYVFDSMFALTDKDSETPLEAPMPLQQFTKLWTFSEDHQQLVIESKAATSRSLCKAFPLVGAQLKKTPEGRAILSGLNGQEEAHHYYSGHRTKNGSKTKRRKARVVPTYSQDEQDVRYLGSWVWAEMHDCICRGGRSCSTSEMLDYIRGPHVPPAAKRKLIEHGVWREFEEAEEDGRKISVDHIVPHDWGATDHPMNYFLLPKSLNSQFNARGVLYEDREGTKVMVTKKQLVGPHAFHAAVSFHRMSLAVKHGFLMVEEAMEIARQTAAQMVQAMPPPAPPRLSAGDGAHLQEGGPSGCSEGPAKRRATKIRLGNKPGQSTHGEQGLPLLLLQPSPPVAPTPTPSPSYTAAAAAPPPPPQPPEPAADIENVPEGRPEQPGSRAPGLHTFLYSSAAQSHRAPHLQHATEGSAAATPAAQAHAAADNSANSSGSNSAHSSSSCSTNGTNTAGNGRTPSPPCNLPPAKCIRSSLSPAQHDYSSAEPPSVRSTNDPHQLQHLHTSLAAPALAAEPAPPALLGCKLDSPGQQHFQLHGAMEPPMVGGQLCARAWPNAAPPALLGCKHDSPGHNQHLQPHDASGLKAATGGQLPAQALPDAALPALLGSKHDSPGQEDFQPHDTSQPPITNGQKPAWALPDAVHAPALPGSKHDSPSQQDFRPHDTSQPPITNGHLPVMASPDGTPVPAMVVQAPGGGEACHAGRPTDLPAFASTPALPARTLGGGGACGAGRPPDLPALIRSMLRSSRAHTPALLSASPQPGPCAS